MWNRALFPLLHSGLIFTEAIIYLSLSLSVQRIIRRICPVVMKLHSPWKCKNPHWVELCRYRCQSFYLWQVWQRLPGQWSPSSRGRSGFRWEQMWHDLRRSDRHVMYSCSRWHRFGPRRYFPQRSKSARLAGSKTTRLSLDSSHLFHCFQVGIENGFDHAAVCCHPMK